MLMIKIHDHQIDISPYPLHRLGLIGTNVDALKAVACLFDGYHAVKREANTALAPSSESSNEGLPLGDSQITRMHIIFVENYCSAARDCDLRSRSAFVVKANLM